MDFLHVNRNDERPQNLTKKRNRHQSIGKQSSTEYSSKFGNETTQLHVCIWNRLQLQSVDNQTSRITASRSQIDTKPVPVSWSYFLENTDCQQPWKPTKLFKIAHWETSSLLLGLQTRLSFVSSIEALTPYLSCHKLVTWLAEWPLMDRTNCAYQTPSKLPDTLTYSILSNGWKDWDK